MNRFVEKVKEEKKKQDIEKEMTELHAVKNFMGGISYEWDPLDTLRLVSASSVFGEPAYYRNGEFAESGVRKVLDGSFAIDKCFKDYILKALEEFDGRTTTEIMEKAIDDALSYDFKATLEWALTLRHDYLMRLNPQVIMVRAAMHEGRKAFTEEYPGLFKEINEKVMSRADEPASQLTYWLYKKGGKNGIPAVLKRSWNERISKMTPYEVFKYRNAGLGLIDTVRICHASSPVIDELMKTGTVSVEESDLTWEKLRSYGNDWDEILDMISIGHMALLRNLRNIFKDISDRERVEKILGQLKAGVKGGKQFPFRYKSAYDALQKADIENKGIILDALEECVDIACENLPRLKGRTVCLSDNSGSAWGTFTSEYGSVTVADINNLSSYITAVNSEEGYVGIFGDRLIMNPVSKRNGILTQSNAASLDQGKEAGLATENGIWIFFDEAIRENEHYDNIFIYSDMQAGHGGLYGTKDSMEKYRELGYATGSEDRYIDVAKLIDVYRNTVNPKVNVFCIQTAGYNNVLVPENGYRTSILYGWTGNELVYADAINRFWDEKDA